MIILRMRDGLGNQMFRYAYARYLQEHYKETIEINGWDFLFDERGCTGRKYALDHFCLNQNVRVAPRGVSLLYTLYMRNRAAHYFQKMGYDMVRGRKAFENASSQGLYISHDNFTVFPFSETNRRWKYVDGWFQEYAYCQSIRTILQREFQLKTPVLKKNQKLYQKIREQESVCMHIRLGDYVTSKYKSTFYLCKPEYYYQAMQRMAEKLENPQFYVFSSNSADMETIRKEYHFPYPVTYVEQDNPDYEDFRLMMSCRHFIISNSSFSWWAQFLADSEKKQVIAPSRWRNHPEREGLKPEGIYDPEWELIEV